VAQGASPPTGHSVLSITLTRPPSATTLSSLRKSAIGVGRRNQAADEIATPQLRAAACASTSAVRRLATAPPCRPVKGPAASGDGRQWWGASRASKIGKARFPEVKYIELSGNLGDNFHDHKRDFVTSDE
jgi:hypothetical protein